MKIIKKLSLFWLFTLLLLCLSGCGNKQGGAPPSAQAAQEQTQAAAQSAKQTTAQTSAQTTPQAATQKQTQSQAKAQAEPSVDEKGSYTSKDEVALYIKKYNRLPDNFITKKEAEKLGWSGGSLEKYAPGKCIGGDRFGNYENKLPKKNGRTYTECDIDTLGKSSRGAKRIVFSNDGLIYYTEDHYDTFTLLYGKP